ncbi:MAG: 50S ribosomal protein L16 [Candidatus Micrarchaeota archaeon]|nr:50S ribosomal protein L16 [Candidatus Micrarchaeota archaeon]
MKLRPGRTVRKINSQAWARYSIKKPKKNYIKALPRTSLLIFNMGVSNAAYELDFTLRSRQNVQLRSNALEAARQAANKYLEREIPGAYFMRLVPFPHNVIREKKFATGAGADRVSQGMTLSFGKPAAVAARVFEGQTVFELKTNAENKDVAREALRRASDKLSGTYAIVMLNSQKQPARAS